MGEVMQRCARILYKIYAIIESKVISNIELPHEYQQHTVSIFSI